MYVPTHLRMQDSLHIHTFSLQREKEIATFSLSSGSWSHSSARWGYLGLEGWACAAVPGAEPRFAQSKHSAFLKHHCFPARKALEIKLPAHAIGCGPRVEVILLLDQLYIFTQSNFTVQLYTARAEGQDPHLSSSIKPLLHPSMLLGKDIQPL